MELPKLVITDIDGVWTDGGMYYDQTGNEWKKFNTSDSAGVLFLKLLNIPIVIITGEDTKIVERRANKLKVDHLFMGVKNKLEIALALCKRYQIKLDDIAFIGDDLNDLELLKAVGLSAAPDNAPDYIKEVVDIVLKVKGGDGAFRAFIENILRKTNQLEKVIQLYTDQMASFKQ